jgi:hypothetical protein
MDYQKVAELIRIYSEKDLTWRQVQAFKSNLFKLCPQNSLNYMHGSRAAVYYTDDKSVSVTFQAPSDNADFRLVEYTFPED